MRGLVGNIDRVLGSRLREPRSTLAESLDPGSPVVLQKGKVPEELHELELASQMCSKLPPPPPSSLCLYQNAPGGTQGKEKNH